MKVEPLDGGSMCSTTWTQDKNPYHITTFPNPFIQQMIIEYLLYAKHCSTYFQAPETQ